MDADEWFGYRRTMTESPNIAVLAAALADPARARMALALMDGRARTVTELGHAVGLGKASASEHAARLADAGLLRTNRQGRHKYLTLASPMVARLIESMMAFAAQGASQSLGQAPARQAQTGPRDPALREARLCYNHLAGTLGVQLYQSLTVRGWLVQAEGGFDLTPAGHAFARSFGLAEADLAPARSPLCRDCLDWSERQSHLGGRLGRIVLARMEGQGWLRRRPDSRALTVTPEGRRAIARNFPVA